jgi:TetR/AcrR family transcriptional regulator, cholesterol catabolism regulator
VNRSESEPASAQAKPSARTTTSGRLLDTAAKLFWTKGYASTTTREIAAVLGVQKASLYHHVSSKEDLLYEICLASLGNIHHTVQAAVDAVEDPLERVRSLIRSHVAAMLVDQDKHSTMLTELRALSGERRAEVVALRDNYEELVRSVLAGAQRAGDLRDDISVKHLSLSLLDLLNWAIFWFQRDGELSPDQLADVFTNIFLSGVKRKD